MGKVDNNPMKAGVNLVLGESRRWMPLEWQSNIQKMTKSKKINDVIWGCVDIVDDYFLKMKGVTGSD